MPGPLAQAHEQLAERLGYHAVRCWAGREYGDMRIASGFDTRIEGGWFLSLERRPTGDHTYQDTFQPLEDGPTDYVDVIRVVWNGQPEDRVVPCKVLNEAYAEVDVLLVDDDGRPLEGGWLMGCRGRWSTDERGRASLQVQADLLSMYEKMTREREALQAVRDETPGLPGEQLDLILEAQTDALQTQADLLGEMGLL